MTIYQQLHNSASHAQNGPDPNCPVCNPSNFRAGFIPKPVEAFAEELHDAYSTSSYLGGWSESIQALRALSLELTDREIEAIIRSKWSRWCADESGLRSGLVTGEHLAQFVLGRAAKLGARFQASLDEMISATFDEEGSLPSYHRRGAAY